MRLCALCVLLILCLAGCAKQTAYAPLSANGGYSEQRIEDDRFQVRFAGNALTPRDLVESFVLLRAAELTRSKGYEGFRIINRNVEPITSFQNFDPRRPDIRQAPDQDPFFDLAPSVSRLTPVTRYEARLEIVMIGAPLDPDDAQIYDASQVAANLSPLARISK